jgi:hypothetical protein
MSSAFGPGCSTVAKTRHVQQDGIRFQGYRYMDPTLAGYVKEDIFLPHQGLFVLLTPKRRSATICSGS